MIEEKIQLDVEVSPLASVWSLNWESANTLIFVLLDCIVIIIRSVYSPESVSVCRQTDRQTDSVGTSIGIGTRVLKN